MRCLFHKPYTKPNRQYENYPPPYFKSLNLRVIFKKKKVSKGYLKVIKS